MLSKCIKRLVKKGQYGAMLAGAFAMLVAAVSFGEVNTAKAEGALAIDHAKGRAWGASWNYRTRAQAARKAIHECGGPGRCRVVLYYRNGCAAWAADQSRGSTVYGWGVNRSKTAAQRRALYECRVRGGRRCLIRVWACER